MGAEDEVRTLLLKAARWLEAEWYAGGAPDSWSARVRPLIDQEIARARAMMADHAHELGLQTIAVFEQYRIRELAQEVDSIVIRLGGRLPERPRQTFPELDAACEGLVRAVAGLPLRESSDMTVWCELALTQLNGLYHLALKTGDPRAGDRVGACAAALLREMRRLERALAPQPGPKAAVPPPEQVTREIKEWPYGPIPANATSVSTFYLPNGFYGRRGAGGELTFLVRIVAGKSEAWLNLKSDSGHFDESNEGQAYYRDGFMEDFSNWDNDSPRYKAPLSFAKWSQQCIQKIISKPIPASPDATLDPAFQGRCRTLFAGNPAEWRAPSGFSSGLLELLRRLPLLVPECYTDRGTLYQALVSAAGLSAEWAQHITDTLTGVGSPAPLAAAVAGLSPDFAEADRLRELRRSSAG